MTTFTSFRTKKNWIIIKPGLASSGHLKVEYALQSVFWGGNFDAWCREWVGCFGCHDNLASGGEVFENCAIKWFLVVSSWKSRRVVLIKRNCFRFITVICSYHNFIYVFFVTRPHRVVSQKKVIYLVKKLYFTCTYLEFKRKGIWFFKRVISILPL